MEEGFELRLEIPIIAPDTPETVGSHCVKQSWRLRLKLDCQSSHLPLPKGCPPKKK